MIRIAQITDLHLVERGELLYGEVDTAANFSNIIEEINRMCPPVDLVLMTGDLADHPTENVYHYLKEIAAGFDVPYYVLPGNHDNPGLMMKVFTEEDHYPNDGPTGQFTINLGKIQILMLNSHQDHSELAGFDEERLKWLEEALKKSQKPTMIAVHHPPMLTGISFVDLGGNDWFKPIANLIEKYSHVERVICGHSHCDIVGTISDVPVYMMSSQAHRLECARDIDVAPSFIDEPAPAVIHSWSKETGFLSGPCPWPADADKERIDKKIRPLVG